MSQREPLIEPTAPSLSIDEGQNNNYNGPNATTTDAAPPAYAMPAAYAPGQAGLIPPVQQNIISQPPAQTNYQPSYNNPSYNPQYQPQQQQPQPQPGQAPQYIPNNNNNNYPGNAHYINNGHNNNMNNNPNGCHGQVINYNDGNYHPRVDNAAAAPASMNNPKTVTTHTTVVVVPANNGYAAMPGNGGYPGAGRVVVAAGGPAPVRAVGAGPMPVRAVNDDPCCIYVFAILSLFFPLLGLITICCLNCGTGLGPRRSMAYRRLVVFTIIGLIINAIYWWQDDWWYDNEDENENNNWN